MKKELFPLTVTMLLAGAICMTSIAFAGETNSTATVTSYRDAALSNIEAKSDPFPAGGSGFFGPLVFNRVSDFFTGGGTANPPPGAVLYETTLVAKSKTLFIHFEGNAIVPGGREHALLLSCQIIDEQGNETYCNHPGSNGWHTKATNLGFDGAIRQGVSHKWCAEVQPWTTVTVRLSFASRNGNPGWPIEGLVDLIHNNVLIDEAHGSCREVGQ